MSKIQQIEYDNFYKCDVCEIEDGRPTLGWREKDFDICFKCLEALFFEHLAPNYKINEKVNVRRGYISENLRNTVLDTYYHKCSKCYSAEKLEIDHIKPFSLGGKTEINNLQVLCKKCNQKKRAKM